LIFIPQIILLIIFQGGHNFIFYSNLQTFFIYKLIIRFSYKKPQIFCYIDEKKLFLNIGEISYPCNVFISLKNQYSLTQEKSFYAGREKKKGKKQNLLFVCRLNFNILFVFLLFVFLV